VTASASIRWTIFFRVGSRFDVSDADLFGGFGADSDDCEKPVAMEVGCSGSRPAGAGRTFRPRPVVNFATNLSRGELTFDNGSVTVHRANPAKEDNEEVVTEVSFSEQQIALGADAHRAIAAQKRYSFVRRQFRTPDLRLG
jgi:hypothetical protein